MYNTRNYTEPKLCTYNDDLNKYWFVYFDIINPLTKVTERKQFRGNINKSKELKERLRLGNYLVQYWTEKLRSGWTPFDTEPISEYANLPFNEALDFGLNKCVVASTTLRAYKRAVDYFKEAAIKLRMSKTPISQIKRQNIKLLLDEIKSTYEWSNYSYNKYVVYFSGVLSRLVEYEIIEHNPAHNIKPLPVVETKKFIPFTEAEKILIREKLTKEHPNFFAYCMVIYHVGIRPKEALALKISDLNFERAMIVIKPDLLTENSKTKKIRIMPMCEHLYLLLKQLCNGFEDKHDYYVFGSPNDKKGNKGRSGGSRDKRFFSPSPNQPKSDTANRLWNILIKKELGIDKYMYANKHTGTDDKLMAGIDLDSLRELYGHSSKFMTQKYASQVKNISFEKIKRLSHGF